jgi:hypothetical protein
MELVLDEFQDPDKILRFFRFCDTNRDGFCSRREYYMARGKPRVDN